MVMLEWVIEFWLYGKAKVIIISPHAINLKDKLTLFIILTLAILKVYGLMSTILTLNPAKKLLPCYTILTQMMFLDTNSKLFTLKLKNSNLYLEENI